METFNTNNSQATAAKTGTRNNTLKTLLLGFALSFVAIQSSAQFVLEPFVGDDKFILESWYYNTIDEVHRLSVFNLNEAAYDYDTENTSVLSYGLVGYDLTKGFGPVAGWRMSQQGSSALAGIQYGK